ncbi:hypothetical protein P1P75_11925 [Streptomyces sp. ID05-39B]|uniref:hypothetical protein n=1 Tax=Streptomyces sp. ID05-39B TaxID=3028664 RepID=UPI0029A89A4D|nr:hypothetical protein [Streptomyces sp. ID05-39B]MDX3527131.1 hypothetical protein [Streptomyces sp. ID05-39B]
MPIVVPRYEAMQYDGTNGQAVVDWLKGTVELVSDDGNQLVVDFLGSQRTIPAGGWVIASGGGAGPDGPRYFSTEQTAADYTNGWLEVTA